MKKKKILVTGASGFIGYEVSRQLAFGNYQPRLLIRRSLRELPIRQFHAEFTQGNLNDPDSLQRAVKGMDAVIHLGARATFESYAQLKPDILEGSVNLMCAAAEAGVNTFVYSSSLLIYGDQVGEVDVRHQSERHMEPCGHLVGRKLQRCETQTGQRDQGRHHIHQRVQRYPTTDVSRQGDRWYLTEEDVGQDCEVGTGEP